MSEEVKAPGLFSWNELVTPDVEAAKAFYSGLFGWSCEEMDMGEGNTYHFFKKGDQPAAGMVQLSPEMEGVQPHWMSYINTDDLDASIATATETGGTLVFGPMQAGNMGKFATVVDPTGAAFSFWQPLGGDCEG